MSSLEKDIDLIRNHQLILLGNEHYNPLGLIRSVGELKLPIIAIVVRGEYRLTSRSKYITKLHLVDSLEDGLKLLLKEYGNEKIKPFVFTCDDAATDYLNTNYDILKDKFYFFNSGEARLVNKYMSKYQQVELARSIGMNVLWTSEILNKQIPEDIVYPIITKAIDSREHGWKKLSYICHNESELKEAFKMINSDRIILQQYIQKKNELGIDGYSVNKGEQLLLSFAYSYKYICDGEYSHYINIFTPKDNQINALIARYIQALNYEGIFDIEFLEDHEGKLYFCEINLRNSGWSYASTTAGMPLPIMWALDTLKKEISCDYQVQIPDGYTAMEGFAYLLNRIKEHKGLVKFVKESISANCHFIFNIKDMKPFFSCVGAAIERKLSR